MFNLFRRKQKSYVYSRDKKIEKFWINFEKDLNGIEKDPYIKGLHLAAGIIAKESPAGTNSKYYLAIMKVVTKCELRGE